MFRVPALPHRTVFAGLLLLSGLLAGCATYPDSYYYEDRYAGDAYNGDYYYGREYDDRYYDVYGGWGGGYYSSVLWPTYFNYYGPWHRSGFYYGISYFPRDLYGFSFGYNRYDPWGYHHYSPYRHSWADNHYAWYGGAGWRHGLRDRNSDPRFGSARNEAERLAQMTRADRNARAYQGVDAARMQSGSDGRMSQASRFPGEQAPRGSYSREIDNGTRGPDGRYEAGRYDARTRAVPNERESRYERGESGWVSGMPARGARAGESIRGEPQPHYQSLPPGAVYKPSYSAPAGSARSEAYSRGRDAGYGAGSQSPQPMRVAPPQGSPGASTSFDRGGDSGSSRGDSQGWSRDRDDGGEPD